MTSTDMPRSRWDALLARTPAWVGDLLAVAVVIVTSIVPGPGRGPGPGHESFPLFLPAVIFAAIILIPLRRRWPLPVLALALGLYCGTVIASQPSTGVGIVAVLAAFSVGVRTNRLTTLIAGGVATTIVAVLSVTVANFGVVDPRVFQIAAGLAVAAALGDSARSHREFLHAATERALRAEQTREAEAQQRVAEERLRIAQDLHDTVAHQISVISLNAGVASAALGEGSQKALAALGTIRTASREVLTEIGELLRYLRTDGETTTAPPQPGLDDIEALVSRMTEAGLAVEVQRDGDLARITGASERVVYRIVQEGLTNAHKHGSARTASVRIAVEKEEAVVTIANPVAPDVPNQPDAPQGGLGLTGIRERVASVGGTVHTEEGKDTFTLIARLPLRKEGRG